MIPYSVWHNYMPAANYNDHMNAASNPRAGHESAMAHMLSGLAEYASAYNDCYKSPIGDDGVLGGHWRDIARGLLGLLNGELGRLDGGSCDSFVRDLAKEHGVDLD